jgi:hypothetical protein
MKTLLFYSMFVIGSTRAFAQGTVIFNNHVAGTIVTHVYAPLPSSPTFSQRGNGSDDTPTSTRDWTAFTLIGANGLGGPFGAGTTFAQLLGANGYDQPETALQPGVPVVSFRTGDRAGNVSGATATFANIPPDIFEATVEMVAWDNTSGLYPTWTQASAAWMNGWIAAGVSGTFNVHGFGPQGLSPTLNDLQSFNLYFTPEPSAMALAGLGAALLLNHRRRAKRTVDGWRLKEPAARAHTETHPNQRETHPTEL